MSETNFTITGEGFAQPKQVTVDPARMTLNDLLEEHSTGRLGGEPERQVRIAGKTYGRDAWAKPLSELGIVNGGTIEVLSPVTS